MILYHASDREIISPDTLHSRIKVDFGKGFYTTPLPEQAAAWCERFLKSGRPGIISKYSFNMDESKKFNTLYFDSYSEHWLSFVLDCRRGIDVSNYDIVAGGVANDRVFNTVELFCDGLISQDEVIKRLQYEKPNYQICFRNQAAINACLCFKGSECR